MPSAPRTPDHRIARVIHADWLICLLTVGAVVRLTRLVTEDVLLEPVRRWLDQRRSKPTSAPPIHRLTVMGSGQQLSDEIEWSDVADKPGPPQDEEPDTDWLVYLIHCRWCASIWIAGPVCAAAWACPHHWFVQIPILALTASLLAGLSGRWE